MQKELCLQMEDDYNSRNSDVPYQTLFSMQTTLTIV